MPLFAASDYPKQGSLKKAQTVRDAITEIRALTDKLELVELGF